MKYTSVLLGIIIACFSFCSSGDDKKDKELSGTWAKIGSFNIEYDNKNDPDNPWSKRKDLVRKTFDKYEFDVVGVQEPYISQLNDLKQLLPDYGYVGKTVTGSSSQDKKLSVGIFYNKDRYSVENWDHFWLSETPDKLSKGWDAQQYRICTWAFLKDKITEEKFYFFSTHLEFKGLEARNESVKLLMDTIPDMTEGYPAVLVGDFNANQNTGDYRLIKNSAIFQDSYSLADSKKNANIGTSTRYSPGYKSSRRIDHIFVAAKDYPIEVRSWSILHDVFNGKLSSDHNPVMIEMSFD